MTGGELSRVDVYHAAQAPGDIYKVDLLCRVKSLDSKYHIPIAEKTSAGLPFFPF